MAAKIETHEIKIEIEVAIPCDITSIDLTTLQITPKTTKVSKFIKKMARLCKKFGYQTIVVNDSDETNKNGGN